MVVVIVGLILIIGFVHAVYVNFPHFFIFFFWHCLIVFLDNSLSFLLSRAVIGKVAATFNLAYENICAILKEEEKPICIKNYQSSSSMTFYTVELFQSRTLPNNI